MKIEDIIKKLRKNYSKCKGVYIGTRIIDDYGNLGVNKEGSKKFTKNIERIKEVLNTVELLLDEKVKT